MELIIKTSAAAISVSIIGLLIRKSNPELNMLMGLSVTVLIISVSLGFMEGLTELSRSIQRMAEGSEMYISPILKCLGVAIISKLSSELCRDSSQSAAASAIEFAGTVCALSIAMPLILSMLNTIGGLI